MILKKIFSGRLKQSAFRLLLYTLALCIPVLCVRYSESGPDEEASVTAKYIKWVEFRVTEEALTDAMRLDIETYPTERHIPWTDALAYLGAKSGGDFSGYAKSELDRFAALVRDGGSIEEITAGVSGFSYYREAYGAVLDGMIGLYEQDGVTKYGLKAFSPIAAGYGYSDFRDFGAKRTYGYARPHLGHDMMGSVGTPIVAVESGYVEACGWNQYGGWRIGIRSFDGKRYYYYAHLRKNHPYCDIYEGKTVTAGEVIGYLGMTGYSTKENVNKIDTPHLHWGIELIFDPSQKDGWNQIWIDLYELTRFLHKNRAEVRYDTAAGEYAATHPIRDLSAPD